jgi:hypothetical protein
MSNIKTVINGNPKTVGSTMFIIGALSLSIVLKLLGEAMFPPYILKYVSEQTLVIYIAIIIILSFVSYKLISKSYIMLTPFLK